MQEEDKKRYLKLNKGKLVKVISLIFTLLLSFVFIAIKPNNICQVSAVSQPTEQNIHVGFFRFDGYHNMSTSGEKSGYGYDFLQMISGYANFKYIYVGYEKTWNDMIEMLDNGEIDILTYGIELPDYTSRFDFSEHIIGTSEAVITTSVTNSTFASNNCTLFNGMKVGFIRDANRKLSFDAYIAEKGLTYTPVYYSNIEEMKFALNEGKEIDCMVADELRVLTDEIIIDKFDSKNLHVMVKKGNTALLDVVDEAIRRLNSDNPGWMVELKQEYFLSSYSSVTSLTLNEQEYIKDLSSASKTLKVLFNPEGYPFTYYSNNKPSGIIIDIFKNLAHTYSLPFEFLPVTDIDDYYKRRENGEADIIVDFMESTDIAEVIGYRLTSSYLASNCSMITKIGFSGTASTIGVINGSDTFLDIAKTYNSKAKIVYFSSYEDCVNAVKKGNVDCTFAYSVTAQMFVIQDNQNKIKATEFTDNSFLFRFAVNSKSEMVLYGIFNKAARNIDSSETQSIVNSYLLRAKTDTTLWDYLMNNPLVLFAIIAFVALVLLAFLLAQKTNSNKLKNSNAALNRSHEQLENALKEANSASAAKTQFLSQMSHDIRTPLNGIIGMTEIAKENSGDEEKVKDSLNKISNSSGHLLTLINDILDLSRIESGKAVISHESTDIRIAINQCLDVLKSSVIGRSIEITTNVDPIEHPYVLTDALHIRQIFINIISNAVKFTHDGGKITINVLTKTISDDQIVLTFICSDTGIGMSQEFQKHMFEPFIQADATDARTQYKGSGLGMSIVKKYLDMLSGTINIESDTGKGTTVTVNLPLDIDKAEKPLALLDEEKEEDQRIDFTGKRILIAEDNDINLEIISVMLKSRGIIIDSAADGKAAVDKFFASDINHYQCILMDIMMPNMNGYEATKAIRIMKRPDASTIPIIAMTANAFTEDVKLALSCGMNAHIAKPIDRKVMYSTLAKFLKN